MRNVFLTSIAATIILTIMGCGADTPTQAADYSDEIVAEIVAGAVGYQSNGFTATVSDVATISLGEKINAASNGDRLIAISQSAAPSNSTPDEQDLSLERRRNSGDLASRWHLNYKLHSMPIAALAVSSRRSDIGVDVASEGLFRNNRQRGQGASKGSFTFTGPAAESINLSGKYSYEGSTTFRGGDQDHYSDVRIAFNWTTLSVARRSIGEFRPIVAQVDVNVSANGPRGVLSRNGRLSFNGTDYATLLIGGKKYFINISSAESVGRI